MVKFIQTSDWQIGMKAGGLGDAGATVREKRIGSISNILNIAKENKVDFVLICGDVFEHNMVSSEDVAKVVSIFNQYPDIPLYLLPGNHDALGPDCVYNRDIFSRIHNLTILRNCEPIDVNGATLYPLPIETYYQKAINTEKIPCVKELEGVHIGVAHGTLVGAFRGPEYELDYPIDPSCLEKSGIDYLALGHWHSCREFEDENGVARIAYSGTHEQTKYDEDSAGYCLLIEVDGKGDIPKITPIKCGELIWQSFDFEMKDAASLNELSKHLESSKEIEMLRLTLYGQIPMEYKGELENLLEFHKTQHRNFRIKNDELQYIVPLKPEEIIDLGDPTLNQTDNYLRSLLQVESDSKRRDVIIEALSLLQRLARVV